MRAAILFGILFASLPFMLARPSVGIILWCWFSYMNPHRFAFGAAYSFPFAMIIAIATMVGLVFSKEPKRIPVNALTVIWVAFAAWMCVTTLFAMVPHEAYPAWERDIKVQIMSFVTLMVMTTRERLNLLVWIIVLSIGFFGIKGGLFVLHTHGEYMVEGPPDSFITGNNSIALALVMIFPLMRYLQLNTKNIWIRLGLAGAMVLCTFAILASYSRGAFLAIAAMGLYLVLKSRRRFTILLAAALVVPLVLSFMPEKYYERIETIRSYQEDASAQGRINAWWFAYNIAKVRPIIGGGFQVFNKDLFKTYAPDPNDVHDAHSIYFQVLGEHGYVGLLMFLTIGLLTVRNGAWIRRAVKGREELNWARDLAGMVQVSLLGYAVGGAFLGLAYFDLYYHLVAIMVLTRSLVEAALQSAPSVVEAGEGVETAAVFPRS